MIMISIRDIRIEGKKVLVRTDFDVPMDENGTLTNDERIKRSFSTIGYLLSNRAKVILISHIGRPDGKIVENLKMDRVAERLQELLSERFADKEIKKMDWITGEAIIQAIEEMTGDQIILLENLRFDPREEAGDREFAKTLSGCADFFVQDAFAACHRPHASISLIPEFILSYSGLELERELNGLTKIKDEAARPFVVILGGAKLDKLELIDDLVKKTDYLLVGGAVANKIIEDQENKEDKDGREKIILPVDGVAENGIVRDIGPKTIEKFCQIISQAKTVVWDGPLGMAEKDEFSRGTKEVSHCITISEAYTVIGGGDTLAIAEQLGMAKHFNFISTGGGAMLEYIAGRELPGIEALQ